MGKVKEEFHYKAKDVETGEVYECYLLRDVADDEEGYGVVIGSDESDETIALGFGQLNQTIAKLLFDCMVYEIENRLRVKGGDLILNDEAFEFDYLSSPYDWEDKEVGAHKATEKDLVKIMAYIVKYHPYIA